MNISFSDLSYAKRRDRSWHAPAVARDEGSLVLPALLLILGIVCWVIL